MGNHKRQNACNGQLRKAGNNPHLTHQFLNNSYDQKIVHINPIGNPTNVIHEFTLKKFIPSREQEVTKDISHKKN